LSEEKEEKIVVVDAENLVLGRMASKIAKLLLEGKKVFVINAEKAVLSGDPQRVIEGYRRILLVQTYRNPERQGIRRERSPRNIVKAAIRGMLPKNKARGKNALKNLRVFLGVPKELSGKKTIRFPEAEAKNLRTKYITVEQVSLRLGWRGSIWRE
jgi:large subunit ribosomal protein L13